MSDEQVVVRTLESTPRGQTHWSTRSLAKAAGLSRMTISRIWRAFGLQPHRTESFKLSPDPLLIEKVRDIVGLYMNRPAHALVALATVADDTHKTVAASHGHQAFAPHRGDSGEKASYGLRRCSSLRTESVSM